MTYRKLVFILSVFLMSVHSLAAAQRILVIHSNSYACKRTASLQDGILDELNERPAGIGIDVEYMDSRNILDREFDQNLFNIIQRKYGGVPFDGIIATDLYAIAFMADHGHELFPGVPIVACGPSRLEWRLLYSGIDAFILAKPDTEQIVEEMKHIFPDLKSINFIYNSVDTLREYNFDFMNGRKRVDHMVAVRIHDNGLNSKSVEELRRLESGEDLILLSPSSGMDDPRLYRGNVSERRLSELCDIPIFVSWDYQLGSGVLGGRVIDSRQIGRQAVKTLFRILGGQEVRRIVSSYEGMYKSVYDQTVMKRLGIGLNRLPEGAEVINMAPSFFYLHRYIIPVFLVLFIFLLSTYRSHSKDLHKQKIINRQKQEIIGLREEFISTQMELIETLGELIEKRSRETGSHVRRVAMLSGLLGRKAGMDDYEVLMMEAASPMHDIGKIAVPDHILQKEGALTDEEFEIIKGHTVQGYEVLNCSHQPLFEVARTIAYSHHENWDGSGYPLGLKGEAIPREARITRIVDVFDALLSERPYKKAWPFEDVMEYMRKGKGRLFDPELLEHFLIHIDEVIEIFWSLEDPEYYESMVVSRKIRSVSPADEPV